MVFTVRLKRPQSIAGRLWNWAQGVCSITPLAFIVLKLTGEINWSWWWVLSPVWISGLLLVLVLALPALLALMLWGAHRYVRMLMHQFVRMLAGRFVSPDERQAWIAARRSDPDASGGDLGFQDGLH